MAKSHARGHEVKYDPFMKQWYYTDGTGEIDPTRPCKKCGGVPTKEGHDACQGRLKNVTSACCGHGVSEPIRIGKVDGFCDIT